MGVSSSDLAYFEEELKCNYCDLEFIKDDMSDRKQSELLKFCRKKLDGKEKVYDLLELIVNGETQKLNQLVKTHNIEEKMNESETSEKVQDVSTNENNKRFAAIATDCFSFSGTNLQRTGLSVICQSSDEKSIHSALGTHKIYGGKIQWKIHIDNGYSIQVGVCNSIENTINCLFSDTKYGYGYGDNGHIHWNGKFMEYNKGFKTGDMIAVCLNMDQLTLSFQVNGIDHGVACELNGNDSDGGYMLAVALQYKSHKITLVECIMDEVKMPSPRPTSKQFNFTETGIESKWKKYASPKIQISPSKLQKKNRTKKKRKKMNGLDKMIHVVESVMQQTKSNKMNKYKEKIIKYFRNNKISVNEFRNMSRYKFTNDLLVYIEKRSLKVEVKQFYDQICIKLKQST
eukprot:67025_1